VSHEQERVPDRLAPRGNAAAEREQAQLLGFGRTPSLPVI